MKNKLIALLIVLVAVCCAKPNHDFFHREFRQQDFQRQDNARRTCGNAGFLLHEIVSCGVLYTLTCWLPFTVYIAQLEPHRAQHDQSRVFSLGFVQSTATVQQLA